MAGRDRQRTSAEVSRQVIFLFFLVPVRSMTLFPERGSIQNRMGRAYWEMIADEISCDGWSWGMCEVIVVELGRSTVYK